jgi:NAD-dependent SIR2 family protein deacetylase
MAKINMTCPSCTAEFEADNTKAVHECPYCGAKLDITKYGSYDQHSINESFIKTGKADAMKNVNVGGSVQVHKDKGNTKAVLLTTIVIALIVIVAGVFVGFKMGGGTAQTNNDTHAEAVSGENEMAK